MLNVLKPFLVLVLIALALFVKLTVIPQWKLLSEYKRQAAQDPDHGLVVSSAPALPLLGHLTGFRNELILSDGDQIKGMGRIQMFLFGMKPGFVIYDDKLAKDVMSRTDIFVPSTMIQLLLAPIATNAVSRLTETSPHKQRRRLLGALFAPKSLSSWSKIIENCMREQIPSPAPGTPAFLKFTEPGVDMHQLVRSWTFTNTALALGIQIDDEYREAYSKMAKYAQEMLHSPLILDRRLNGIPSPLKSAYQTAAARVRALTGKIVEKRRQELDGIPPRTSMVNSGDLSFLDGMLLYKDMDGNRLTQEHIVDETVLMLFAGQDSVPAVIAFVMAMFAKYEDVQHKCRQEVDKILGENDDFPSLDQVAKMSYLHAVVLETLRLEPGVPASPRDCVQDTELGGVKIKAGSMVLVSIRGLHRQAQYWPEPDQFKPERFLNEDGNAVQVNVPLYAYMPFLHGQRECLGRHLAMIEIRLILATLLSRFEFKFETVDWNTNLKTMNSSPKRVVGQFVPRRGRQHGSAEAVPEPLCPNSDSDQ